MDEFKNQITKYASEMNDIAFENFTERELNMFFALITNMRDRDVKRATFSYSEMKKAMGLENTHITNAEFKKEMIQMWEKLNKLTCYVQTKTTFLSFVLFPTFTMDDKKSLITIAVNQDFSFVLNRLTNYTYFRLEKFRDVRGKYAKILYSHLCQFRKSGKYYVTLDEFRRLLCIPESYSTKEIMRKVIKPSVEELGNMEEFKKLKCNPHYLSLRGRPVSGYEFIWEADMDESAASDMQDEDLDRFLKEEDYLPGASIEDVITQSEMAKEEYIRNMFSM